MPTVRTSIDIDAGRDVVWDVLMDPQRLADWVTIHRHLGRVSGLPLREGSTIEQTLALRGAHFKVRWTVVELSAPRRAIWEGRGPARSRARIDYALTARDGATHFDYLNEFHAPGGPLGAVASRVVVGPASERESVRSLARLKSLIEGRGAAAP